MLADSPILCDILICNIPYQNEVKKMGEKKKRFNISKEPKNKQKGIATYNKSARGSTQHGRITSGKPTPPKSK